MAATKWSEGGVLTFVKKKKTIRTGGSLPCASLQPAVVPWIVIAALFQELSPTVDINLAVSLMRLMDAQMDEFEDAATITRLGEKNAMSWIEVRSRVALLFS